MHNYIIAKLAATVYRNAIRGNPLPKDIALLDHMKNPKIGDYVFETTKIPYYKQTKPKNVGILENIETVTIYGDDPTNEDDACQEKQYTIRHDDGTKTVWTNCEFMKIPVDFL